MFWDGAFNSSEMGEDEYSVPNISLEREVDLNNANWKKTISISDLIISNHSLSVQIPANVNIDLIEYAKRNKNCIINPDRPWRCILHCTDMTITMSGMRAWMVSTRIMDTAVILERMEQLFLFVPFAIRTTNMTFSINTGSAIDIFSVYKRRRVQANNGVQVKSYHLDEQRYPALRIHTFSPTHVALEVYASGRINLTGMKDMQSVQQIVDFINDSIL